VYFDLSLDKGIKVDMLHRKKTFSQVRIEHLIVLKIPLKSLHHLFRQKNDVETTNYR
jgi:hypothetical protein